MNWQIIKFWLSLLFGLMLPIISVCQTSPGIVNPFHQNISFIENKGQWDKEVKFLARFNGMKVWVTESGIVFDLYQINKNNTNSLDSISFLPGQNDTGISIKGHVFKMNFPQIPGIVSKKHFEGRNQQPGYFNYFIGNDSSHWASHVKLWSEVIIKDVAPSIDMRIYVDQQMPRYDLIIHPGGNPDLLLSKIEGQDSLSISENGELLIKTSMGELTNKKIFAFQEFGNKKVEIACQYKLNGNGQFGFITAKYNHSLPLFLDPLIYSTFIGSSGVEVALGVKVDPNNCPVVIGVADGNTFPTTNGSYQKSYAGGTNDVFITKLNFNASSLVFSTFIGGNNYEHPRDLQVDQASDIYLTGVTYSSNFPVVNAYQSIRKGHTDAFITKLNAAGTNLIFSTYLGGTVSTYGTETRGIAIDTGLNVYVCGWTTASNFPVTSGAFQVIFGGPGGSSGDGFVSKLSASGGTLLASTFLGGISYDVAYAIALDGQQNVYVAGGTTSTGFPVTSGCLQPGMSGTGDAYISKLNNNLTTMIFSTFFGGSSNNEGINSIVTDSANNIIIAGITKSYDLKITTGAYKTSFCTPPATCYSEIFISKINSSGTTLMRSTFMGGSKDEYWPNLMLDTNENVVLTATSYSTDYPVTANAYMIGGATLVISSLDSSLTNLLYSSYIGFGATGISFDPDKDSLNNFYLAGGTVSSNFQTTPGVYQPNYILHEEGFLCKLNFLMPKIYLDSFGPLGFCPGQKLDIPYQIDFPFYPGNIFVAELSDSNGSFSKPDTIGRLNYQLADTIKTVIPKKYYTGNRYRIRVSGSRPVVHSLDNKANLTINAAPQTNFVSYDSTQCLKNNEFSFVNRSTISTGAIINHHWEFGDNDSSLVKNPTHIFGFYDTFKVTLVEVSNLGCRDSLIKNMVVHPSPVADFTINDSIQCSKGNNFVYVANYSIPYGSLFRNWFFGDGDTGSKNIESHIYKICDTFHPCLIVFTANNCRDTLFKTVIVQPSPKSGFTYYSNTNCLNGNNFLLTDTSADAIKHHWELGDGYNDTALIFYHSYLQPDTFQVKLTVENDIGCEDSTMKDLIINPSPVADFSMNDTFQCLKNNLFKFNNTGTFNTASGNWLWDFGDGTNAVTKSASHHWLVANSYLVRLKVTNQSGCKDSVQKAITVLPSPKAGFTYFSVTNCLNGNNFLLTDTSVDAIKHDWELGDANYDTASIFYHSFINPDTFHIKLTVENDIGCQDTSMKTIIISPSPVANFTMNDTFQCLKNNLFIFNNTGTLNTATGNWFWDFGDGNTALTKSASHSWLVANSYLVRLKATNQSGCKDSIQKTITIFPSPKADFSINDSDQCLNDNLFVFNNLGNLHSPNGQWKWKWGDGTTDTSMSANHHWQSIATFYPWLIAVNQYNCKDSLQKKVIVWPSPDGTFTINDSDQCMNGNNFIFSAKWLPAGGNWQWNFGDNKQTVIKSWPSPGIYDIKLVVTNNYLCKDSSLNKIFVFPSPKANFTVNDPGQCLKNNLFRFTNLSDSANNYFWSFGDLLTDVVKDPIHKYSASGFFRVSLIASTFNNCFDTFFKNITVQETPEPPVISSNSPVCEGETLFLSSPVLGNTLYRWYSENGFSSGLSSPKINNVKQTDAGNYFLKISLWGCESDSSVINVVVNPAPKPYLGNAKTICRGDLIILDPGFFDNYLWQDSSKTRRFNVSEPGIYFVKVTNSFNCYGIDTILIDEKCPYVLYIPSAFSPNQDGINDEFSITASSISEISIKIFDRWGEEVFYSDDILKSWDGTYRGTDCPVGVYFYQIFARKEGGLEKNVNGTVNLFR